jgi:hypothetical protein
MAVWHTITVSRTQPRKFAFKQKGRNCHYYLQRAVKTDGMGSFVLCVLRVEKPSDDINSHLVLMNKKDWLMWGRGRTLAKMCVIALFFLWERISKCA